MSAERKDEHVRLAESLRDESRRTGFDDVAFLHQSLGGVDLAQVSTATHLLGADWRLPFYINAMTGGTERTARINAGLGRASAATGVAIATGSQRVALTAPEREESFRVVREGNPDGFVFANVGPTVSPEGALRAVEMLHANALQVHVNPAQELVMPEGDRVFSTWPDRIAAIAEAVPVPVLVKEVGFGLSRRSILQLSGLGVAAVDVAGAGGTNFIAIENQRRKRAEYGYLSDWGQSAVFCLADALRPEAPVPVEVVASGAVHTPLDVVRALALGARAVGVSGHFLHTLLQDGEEALIAELRAWESQVRTLMALLGAATVPELQRTDLLITGRTRELLALRGIDVGGLSRRSEAAPSPRGPLSA
ncbi:MAG: type 2 isopentenyl-diphosphate Delta-isomerase [Microbacteriaceae bacterium]|nr:type 2 isopentenyl-diphosphate Delta-isomerase [Microbacteriaceae bacterium]